jgi:hypothetical protein
MNYYLCGGVFLKTKTKRPYSLASNLGYTLRWNWQESPRTLLWAGIGTLARVAAPFTAILMPKIVIDALTNGYTPAQFVATVGGFALLLAVLSFFQTLGGDKIDEEFGMISSARAVRIVTFKKTDMDYESCCSPDLKTLEQKVQKAAQSNHTPAANTLKFLSGLIVQILGLCLYGSVISTVHWALLPLIMLSAVAGILMLRRANAYEEKVRADSGKAWTKANYTSDILANTSLAKDLRLYGMHG